MQFQVKLKDGSLLDVPDKVEINLQEMRIIGDGRTDWNEPYGQNFMVLSNGVENLKDEVATKADTSYVDAELAKKVSTASFNSFQSSVGVDIAAKANAVDVAASIQSLASTKADIAYVDSKVAGIDMSSMYSKADIGTVADFTTALG